MFNLGPLPLDLIGKILLAAGLGAIMGIERDLSGRSAGLRTNLIIAVSSCLLTILSAEAFRGSNMDPTRIAASIVTGVGFLGAGALIHDRAGVHGLTTAATIWLVSAIGMAVGAGMGSLAIFVTLISVCALVVLAPISHTLDKKATKKRKL